MASTTSWDLWISSCSEGSGANVVRQANETTATIWGHEVLLGPNFHENVFFSKDSRSTEQSKIGNGCKAWGIEQWKMEPKTPVTSLGVCRLWYHKPDPNAARRKRTNPINRTRNFEGRKQVSMVHWSFKLSETQSMILADYQRLARGIGWLMTIVFNSAVLVYKSVKYHIQNPSIQNSLRLGRHWRLVVVAYDQFTLRVYLVLAGHPSHGSTIFILWYTYYTLDIGRTKIIIIILCILYYCQCETRKQHPGLGAGSI